MQIKKIMNILIYNTIRNTDRGFHGQTKERRESWWLLRHARNPMEAKSTARSELIYVGVGYLDQEEGRRIYPCQEGANSLTIIVSRCH